MEFVDFPSVTLLSLTVTSPLETDRWRVLPEKVTFSHEKMTFSAEKVTFRIVKVTFSNEKVTFRTEKIPFTNENCKETRKMVTDSDTC